MSHMTQKPPKAVRAYLAGIGRIGGLKRSKAKADAARANAAKPRPGRRKKTVDTA